MRNKELFILISILSLVATVLVLWKVFLAPKVTSPPLTPIPTPVFLPTPTPYVGRGDPNIEKEIQKETQEKYPLLVFIPYQTPNWEIDYLSALTLEVILKQDTPQTRQEVLDWIWSKGVNPTTHQINWKIQP